MFRRFQQTKYPRQEIKLIVVNILQNWSYRYSIHNSNIKCVESIIKYIDFESINHVINLDPISSFMIFNDFYFMFILIYY